MKPGVMNGIPILLGVSFILGLFAALLALKLAGAIAWPWLWITAPVWMSILINILFFGLMGVIISAGAVRGMFK